MHDVLEVDFDQNVVRVIAENKDSRNAEAIVNMAVMRRGVDRSFFTTAPAGKYGDGDKFGEYDA